MYQGSFHYLGDKQDFKVSSEGSSSGNKGPSFKTSKSC